MSETRGWKQAFTPADQKLVGAWHRWFVGHWGCEPLFVLGERPDGAVQLCDAVGGQPDPDELEREFLAMVQYMLRAIADVAVQEQKP